MFSFNRSCCNTVLVLNHKCHHLQLIICLLSLLIYYELYFFDLILRIKSLLLFIGRWLGNSTYKFIYLLRLIERFGAIYSFPRIYSDHNQFYWIRAHLRLCISNQKHYRSGTWVSVEVILHKSYELVFSKVHKPLRNFLIEMDYWNLLVIRSHGLVCKQRKFNDVLLLHRFLRIN